jgi:hypothetical protein
MKFETNEEAQTYFNERCNAVSEEQLLTMMVPAE